MGEPLVVGGGVDRITSERKRRKKIVFYEKGFVAIFGHKTSIAWEFFLMCASTV